MKCIFQNPVNLANEAKPDFEFSEMVCDDILYSIVEHPTYPNPEHKFAVLEQYTYGEITMILLLGVISLVLVFKTLRDLFFHKEVEIHTISQKKF